ncbi:MAG: tRNA(Ile)(2)-agmatinylcytidine synthase [Methanimicrococcus sp.]|nr:tRNA(Ile)(2)-agmatinylcytidine synthase [Methanimicrococcus sp.]
MLIGIDDTDSNEGMCTTYLTALLADELKKYGVIKGYPYLIRLNPNIPYKTRGNAALGIELTLNESSPFFKKTVMNHVISRIEEYSKIDCDKTNPGVVFIFDEDYGQNYEALQTSLNSFFKKAVIGVIEIEEAFSLLNRFSIPFFSLKNGRGLIGALAACGAMLHSDWEATYEYLAYRLPQNWGSNGGPTRFVDEESLIKADRQTTPETWDTIDFTKKTKPFSVCVPGSPDPVLFGIRGNFPEAVLEVAKYVVSEEIERSQVFKTNQGTDAHLIHVSNISEMKPLHSYVLSGVVCRAAETLEGGHDIIQICDFEGNKLSCAAYEPTGKFRHTIRQLIPNDCVTVFGSLKGKDNMLNPDTLNPDTLNLEKIKITFLEEKVKEEAPLCPNCQKRMESAGKSQGFRCKMCKTQKAKSEKIVVKVPRNIRLGYYEVPPSARRHLSKPLIRYSADELI